MPKETLVVANTGQDLELELKPRSQDGRAWIGVRSFGKLYLIAYPTPSSIPYDMVGSIHFLDPQGYWHNGQCKPFSKAKRIRYQNSALGRD